MKKYHLVFILIGFFLFSGCGSDEIGLKRYLSYDVEVQQPIIRYELNGNTITLDFENKVDSQEFWYSILVTDSLGKTISRFDTITSTNKTKVHFDSEKTIDPENYQVYKFMMTPTDKWIMTPCWIDEYVVYVSDGENSLSRWRHGRYLKKARMFDIKSFVRDFPIYSRFEIRELLRDYFKCKDAEIEDLY